MIASKQDLVSQALNKALEVRDDAGLDYRSPICIYALCDELGIRVRFDEVSMEGVYVALNRPTIVLSSLRPLARKVFTCGHEVGHFVFGHGSSIDEIIEESSTNAYDENEFLVNAFSGFLLMPPVAVKRAFFQRGWDPTSASPEQVFVVACAFGVGYETLVGHLAYGLHLISHLRALELKKTKLPGIRKGLLGLCTQSRERLVVADLQHDMPTLDAEVDAQVLLPAGAVAESEAITFIEDLPTRRLFLAKKPGIVRVTVPRTTWAVMVRVSRYQYAGLSRYRHLEEVDDE